MSKHREVTWDHRRSRKNIHVGKVSVFFRGASWHIYYREDGKARRIRIGPDPHVFSNPVRRPPMAIECGRE